MHGDGQNVLRHQNLEPEPLDETMGLILNALLDGLDLVGDGATAKRHAEEFALYISDLGVPEESEWRDVADFRWGVEQASRLWLEDALPGQLVHVYFNDRLLIPAAR
jgi:hypothetical protein